MKSDPWEIFRAANLGDNVQEVVETEDCKVLRMNTQNGDGVMTIYRVFDGIYLMYNDFHMKSCYSQFTNHAGILCLDHCREDCIEHKTSKGQLYYIEAGDLRIDRSVHHIGTIDFPLCHYHGITIGFFMSVAMQSIQEAMPGIKINLEELFEKFVNDERPYILRQKLEIEHIFSELYSVLAKIRMDYFKLKILELLVYLSALELSDYKDERSYFFSSQIEKIKAAHTLMTDDLAVNYTAEDLAERFDISVNVLKSGFKSVYGSPIYTYIRNHKMNVAASLLVVVSGDRIADIPAKDAQTGKTFVGWFASEDGGITLSDTAFTSDTVVTGNLDLYPKYERNSYTVTFNSNGGSYRVVLLAPVALAVLPPLQKQ